MKFTQVAPELQESPFLSLVNEMGIEHYFHDVAFYGNHDYREYTFPAFDEVISWAYEADALVQDFLCGDNAYSSIEEIVNQFFEPVVKDWDLWVKILGEFDESWNSICAMLYLVTGKKYDWNRIRGYLQGDWQDVFFPVKDYDKNAIARIEAEYFNTGSEWIDEDNCSYYSVEWNDDAIKRDLAERSGIPVEEIKLLKFIGYKKIAQYEEV